jgi:hypothetical protein
MSLQSVMDQVQQYIGIADFAADVLPTLTPDITEAIVAAETDPTSTAVERVIELYARHDVAPPVKLVAHLLMINEQRHPDDTVKSDLLPWVIAGGIVIYLLFFRRR